MKRICLITVLLVMVACGSIGEGGSMVQEGRSGFKMVLRCWQRSYVNDTLRNGLLEQLKRYRVFDEMWMCLGGQEYASQIKEMADGLKAIGIDPCTEQITIGHLSPVPSVRNFDPITRSYLYGDFEDDPFAAFVPEREMIGNDGKTAAGQNCPRSKAFIEYISAYTAGFAELINPARMFLDDDLRIYNHAPVWSGCFCDSCLAEFNFRTGGTWTRRALSDALEDASNAGLREEWVKFGEESLAHVAGSIARAVHKVSPSTAVCFENGPNSNIPQTGGMLPSVFDSLYAGTGIAPSYRPGAGFYNDWTPRDMIKKANQLARQIRNIPSYITRTPAEIECYHHTSSGKSPEGAAVESMLYLAMGCSQLSYHILGSCDEPMEWYADNYFSILQKYKPYFKEYADFNSGTEPGGIDEYHSPTCFKRTDKFFGSVKVDQFADKLQALGIPFTPGGHYPCAYLLDEYDFGKCGVEDVEFFRDKGLILDEKAFGMILDGGYEGCVTEVPVPEGIRFVRFFTTSWGGRIAVIPSVSPTNVNIRRRDELFAIADWVSGGKLPVIAGTMAQEMFVPRVDADGKLRSVLALNCSISDSCPVTLRLRGASHARAIVWKTVDAKDKALPFKHDGDDIVVTIPSVPDWRTGWIAIKE